MRGLSVLTQPGQSLFKKDLIVRSPDQTKTLAVSPGVI